MACSVRKREDCDRKGTLWFSWERVDWKMFVQSTPGFLLEIVLAPHIRVGRECIVPAKAFICIAMAALSLDLCKL